MKKQFRSMLSTAVTLTLVNFAVNKQVVAEDETTAADICALYSDYARAVMEKRQGGLSVRQLLETAGDEDDSLNIIIITAWDEPVWNDPNRQAKAIVEYGDEVYLSCLKSKAK